MKVIAETERLLLRELQESDEQGMFDLDSDPEVHRYVGKSPVESIEEIKEIIKFIQQQYKENGVARWAVIRKSDNAFLGWCGLKLFKNEINGHVNFYELGYRFQKQHWGNGFATEAAKASVNYGFNTLGIKEIYAMTDPENTSSNKVLQKAGFQLVNNFIDNDEETNWFKIEKK